VARCLVSPSEYGRYFGFMNFLHMLRWQEFSSKFVMALQTSTSNTVDRHNLALWRFCNHPEDMRMEHPLRPSTSVGNRLRRSCPRIFCLSRSHSSTPRRASGSFPSSWKERKCASDSPPPAGGFARGPPGSLPRRLWARWRSRVGNAAAQEGPGGAR
jgi:hypothetical protein